MGDSDIDDIVSYIGSVGEYILLLANAQGEMPIKGDTWLQKEMFLLSKNIESVNESASFEPDFFGPFSDAVREETDELILDDLLDKKGDKIQLTPLGTAVVNKVRNKVSHGKLTLIEDIKGFLNDMSSDELLVFIYFTYPDMADASLVSNKIKGKRVPVSLRLYKKGKVTMEKAAELAGVPLEKFMELVKVPIQNVQ